MQPSIYIYIKILTFSYEKYFKFQLWEKFDLLKKCDILSRGKQNTIKTDNVQIVNWSS